MSQIGFTINIETAQVATAAITSLSSAVSSGALAQTFQEEATKRDLIVSVAAVMTEEVEAPAEAVAAVAADVASNATYYAIAGLNVALLLLICVLWVFVLYRIWMRSVTAAAAADTSDPSCNASVEVELQQTAPGVSANESNPQLVFGNAARSAPPTDSCSISEDPVPSVYDDACCTDTHSPMQDHARWSLQAAALKSGYGNPVLVSKLNRTVADWLQCV